MRCEHLPYPLQTDIPLMGVFLLSAQGNCFYTCEELNKVSGLRSVSNDIFAISKDENSLTMHLSRQRRVVPGWRKLQVSEVQSGCVLLTWVWWCQSPHGFRPMEKWQSLQLSPPPTMAKSFSGPCADAHSVRRNCPP